MNPKDLLDRCDLSISKAEALKLIGVPFSEWGDAAREQWYWNGWTRKGYINGTQWNRARAMLQVNNKIISPARPLWELFTGITLRPEQRIAYQLRGVRECQKDDVNPSNYILLQPRDKPKRKYNKKPKVLADVAALFQMADYWPTTVEELLTRWPDLTSCSREDLNETIRVTSLS